VSRNLILYLDDILNSIEKIERYTTNMNQDTFVADERTVDISLLALTFYRRSWNISESS
jgi:uncharacterized protein with HEPN domain